MSVPLVCLVCAPVCSLQVSLDMWASTKPEFVVDVDETRKLTVCLVRVRGVPILNGLELRLLPRGSYPTTEQTRRPGQDVLVNLARVTCDPGTATDNTSYRCALRCTLGHASHGRPVGPRLAGDFGGVASVHWHWVRSSGLQTSGRHCDPPEAWSGLPSGRT